MKDILKYIFNEVKNKRLPKEHAIDLIHQFQTQIGCSDDSEIPPQKLDIDLCDNVQEAICDQNLQAGLPSSIPQNSLRPLNVVRPVLSNIADKPREISLQSLSNHQIPSSKPANQAQQPAVLSSSNVLPLQSKSKDESKSVTLVRTNVSAESLQEELRISLAEALYMKRNDVDVDTKFIDLGLDSIIGVEWIKVINKQYGTSIPATKVYDYPSIREFAGFLEKELNKREAKILEDGDKELTKKIKSAPEQSPILHLSGLSKKPISLAQIPSPFEMREENSQGILKHKNEIGKNKIEHVHKKADLLENNILELKPENLGNPIFQRRYRCRWNYCSGSMFRGIASEQLVVTMGRADLLSFFGSAGFSARELEKHIQNIQSQLSPGEPYGMCLICNLNYPEEERQQVELFLQYKVPVIEAAAYSTLTMPLVYCRIKGLYQEGDRIILPRRIIAKCSRLETAHLFLSPPPIDMVNYLLESEMINEEEAKLSQYIPMADDLAMEADSGGHTDQGVSFTLIPAVISLKEKMKQQYNYQEEILIGCGGGIGTPEAVASAFMLGADFIFTGSINQCTVESGAHDVVKELLNTISVHDTAITIAGDMFEIGAKVQVVIF